MYRNELSGAGLNPRKEHNQCSECCIYGWKASQASDKMRFGSLPEESKSQIIKEVGKSGYVLNQPLALLFYVRLSHF